MTEHFTTPPKPHNEATLLSAMERAGNEDTDPDAERRGLGTPATRAAVIEKLVKSGFVERKGKQLIPTENGNALISILPDMLTSPMLTAEWENTLTQIAKGAADAGDFIEERKVAFSPKIAAALLKSGKANVKGLYSPKTGKTYDGAIVLADTGGKYVNYKIELPKKK